MFLVRGLVAGSVRYIRISAHDYSVIVQAFSRVVLISGAGLVFSLLRIIGQWVPLLRTRIDPISRRPALGRHPQSRRGWILAGKENYIQLHRAAGPCVLNAVLVDVDEATGKASSVERIDRTVD